jgi:hypothetical protein
MLLHVAVSDAVRNTLIAEGIDQPVENPRRVVPLHRRDDTVPRQADPRIVDYASCTSNPAYAANQSERPTKAQGFCC